MTPSFISKLKRVQSNFTGRSGKPAPEHELKQMLQYGVTSESGDNYYLFIYRDFLRKTPYYGAVICLDKPDPLADLPVTITGLEENGKEQLRNIYVQAALYHLETGAANTMSLSGRSAAVFEMARKKILPHIHQDHKLQEGTDVLESFQFPPEKSQPVWTEIPPAPPPVRFDSTRFQKNLTILTGPLNSTGEETVTREGIPATIGLNLVSQQLDLSGEKQKFFEPVLVPLKKGGRPGRPVKASDKNLEIYTLIQHTATDLLSDFFTAFCAMDRVSSNRGLKARLLNALFFRELMDTISSLPPGFCFCQLENDRTMQFRRITPTIIDSLHLRLAPHLKKDSVLRFFLRITFRDGEETIEKNAANRFEVIRRDNRCGLVFETSDGDCRLGLPPGKNGDPVNDTAFQRLLHFLEEQPEIKTYDLDDMAGTFSRVFSGMPSISLEKEPLKKYELSILPDPLLKIYFPDQTEGQPDYRMELTFDYNSPMRRFTDSQPDKEVCSVKKATEFEKQCREAVESDPLLDKSLDLNRQRQAAFHGFHFQDNDFTGWLLERGRRYLSKGFKIYNTKWKHNIGSPGSRIAIRVSQHTDWLEFAPYIHDPVLNREIPLAPELDIEALENGMVHDKKGTLYSLSENDIEKLARLIRNAEQQAGKFRVPSRNHVLINRLCDGKTVEETPGETQPSAIQESRELVKRLKKFEKIEDYPLGYHFKGKLREYQEHGFKWLRFLKEYGFSGCLADDMGLGKTVQTLALLQTLKEENSLNPSLLVVPVSAMPNWEAEIARFAPGLTIYIHMGSQRNNTKNKAARTARDLVITSYGTLRSDIEELADIPLDWVILDESQNIKNPVSQVSRAVKRLSCKHRLALSGTPIENNTLELWSLFDFLMPGFLGTRSWFQREMMQPVERDRDEDKIDLLKKMIFPFILRRKKGDVEKELPEKTEIVSSLRMDERQAEAYGETAKMFRETLEHEINAKGVPGASMKIIEAMLRLRQICLFPGLADEEYDEQAVPSAKFDYLRELLEEILAENHKVLIFSQFVQVLERIRGYCLDQAIRFSYLDGSMAVKEREQMVNRFQDDEETRVFLLSLKAGGVALNLTAADYVIIFDPWWNPAVEAQAIDRSHRIGQTKRVMVYRMVMQNTIEEKILALQDRKKALVDDLVTTDSPTFKDLGKDDILELFRF